MPPELPADHRSQLRPYRRIFFFDFSNTITWMLVGGAPMVLFAEFLGASPVQVGWLASMVMLLNPLQVFATALLPRFGYKKLMVSMWSMRAVMVVPVFLLALWNPAPAPWVPWVPIVCLFLYSFCRGIGVAAGLPWVIAWVPGTIRGRIMGTTNVMISLAGIFALTVSGVAFATLETHLAFAVVFGLGILAAIAAVGTILFWPDIPVSDANSWRSLLLHAPRLLREKGRYRQYLWLVTVRFFVEAGTLSLLVFYLKRNLGLPNSTIIVFSIVQQAVAVGASHYVRNHIDERGPLNYFRRSIAVSVASSLLLAVLFNLGSIPVYAFGLVFVMMGVTFPHFQIAQNKYLPDLFPEDIRPLGMNLYFAISSMAAGCSPVFWSWVVKDGDHVDPLSMTVYVLISALVVGLTGFGFRAHHAAAEPGLESPRGSALQ